MPAATIVKKGISALREKLESIEKMIDNAWWFLTWLNVVLIDQMWFSFINQAEDYPLFLF